MTEPAPGAESVDLARRYFDAMSRHDLDAAAACWRPGAVNHLAPIGALRVPDETRPFFEEVFAAMPDYRYELLDVVAESDRVVVRWRATGRFTGARYRGIRPNGTRLELEGVDMLLVDGTLIRGNDAYWDEASVARQIGLLPPRGSRQERFLVGLFNARSALRSRLQRRS